MAAPHTTISPDFKLHVTLFNDAHARFKREQEFTFKAFKTFIANTTAERKDALPWLKLAKFGDLASAK